VGRFRTVAGAARGAFASTLAVAKRALAASVAAEQPYDVVVGFSWGGALAVELLKAQRWAGPLVLLAPAHRLVAAVSTTGAPETEPQSPQSPSPPFVRLPTGTVVIHSNTDTLVPLEHSVNLVKQQPAEAKCRFVEVNGDRHAMWSIASDGSLVRAVLEVAATARPSE